MLRPSPNRNPRTRRLILISVLFSLGSMAFAQSADIAMPVSSVSTSQASAPISLDETPDASSVYNRMAAFLASRSTFFVELNSTTTITVNGNQKINGGLSRVWYRRPDHVVWTTQSDIGASALAIDGKNCTLYLPSLSKYMVTPAGDSFDGQLASMSAPYGILATALFSRDTSTSLQTLLKDKPRLQGTEPMLEVRCHHVKLATYSGAVDLWIADGPIPLPVKIASTMTIPPSPGQDNGVESRTEVSFIWRINVDLPDSTFNLKLPETAVKMDKLGSPVVASSLPPRLSGGTATTWNKPEKPSAKSSSKARDTKKKTESKQGLGLAFDPPPDLDLPVSSHGNSGVPSLSGEDDVVAAAIRGSRPDSVPSGASFQPSQNQSAPPPPSSSAQSPSMNLTLLDGKSISLGAYKGRKAVVLDFWATWCGPCQQSMPIVNQVANAYRNRGVEFFAVNMAETGGQIQSYIQQQGISLPVATDHDGRLAASFGVSGIPHLVVIGKDGTIKGTHTGADPNLAQSLMRDLDIAIR